MSCLSEPPVIPNLGNQRSGFTLVGFLWLTKSSLNILVKGRKILQAHWMASTLYPDWGTRSKSHLSYVKLPGSRATDKDLAPKMDGAGKQGRRD